MHRSDIRQRILIYNGKLNRGNCIECNASSAEAHHEDYNFPLDIIWLCSSCHRTRHILMRKEKVGDA